MTEPIICVDNVHKSYLMGKEALEQIYLGQPAVVTLKAFPDRPIEATVARVGLQAGAPVGDAVTFPVILALGETGLELRPGMTGRAEILARD